MQKLNKHSILSSCKNYENDTCECSQFKKKKKFFEHPTKTFQEKISMNDVL